MQASSSAVSTMTPYLRLPRLRHVCPPHPSHCRSMSFHIERPQNKPADCGQSATGLSVVFAQNAWSTADIRKDLKVSTLKSMLSVTVCIIANIHKYPQKVLLKMSRPTDMCVYCTGIQPYDTCINLFIILSVFSTVINVVWANIVMSAEKEKILSKQWIRLITGIWMFQQRPGLTWKRRRSRQVGSDTLAPTYPTLAIKNLI